MARAQRDLFGWATLSGYYAYYTLENAKYLSVSGTEHRDIIDVRFYAKTNDFDGDIEVMSQTGSIGNDTIRAWAVGSVSGYTLSGYRVETEARRAVRRRLRQQRSPRQCLQTFNPLFPNGLLFYTRRLHRLYELIHFKPSIDLTADKFS